MNLLLFGPPGIGKTTLITQLQYPGNGIVALDSEKVWDDKAMKGRLRQLLQVYPQVQRVFGLPPLVVGAAGFDPTILYPGFSKVLLSLSQEKYELRRDRRNAKHPEFAKQGAHTIEHWLGLTKWGKVIDVSENVGDVVVKLHQLAYSKGASNG